MKGGELYDLTAVRSVGNDMYIKSIVWRYVMAS